MTTHVVDYTSNAEENIDYAARRLSRDGLRRRLWEFVYTGKKNVKTTTDIAKALKADIKQVLTVGRQLEQQLLLVAERNGGRVVGYCRLPHLLSVKRQILSAAKNPKRLAAIPTKRRPRYSGGIKLSLPRNFRGRAMQITIDEVDEFRKVRRIRAADLTTPLSPNRLPEKQFKAGVVALSGDRGEFKDWGGEDNDFLTTHFRLGRRRVPMAFAFKGPAKRGALTPAKMGKNGDQIQRLIRSPAEAFWVQYEGQIADSVLHQLRDLVMAHAVSIGRDLRYGIIDLADSYRLRAAYPRAFRTKPKN